MTTFAYICAIIVAAWLTIRVGMFVWGRIRRKRAGPAGQPQGKCPKCGSKNLDQYSDAQSGHCLDCKHVWGVDAPPTES